MKLKVIDDFLSSDSCPQNGIPQWMYSEGVDTSDDGYHQLCHIFYSQFEPKKVLSSTISYRRPLGSTNLNMKTSEREEYSFHTDVDNCFKTM